MEELIDKNGAIKLIEKEFDMNCLTEWGQGYIDAMKDVKGIIALLPTTTEAEIREKAKAEVIDEFAEKLKWEFKNSIGISNRVADFTTEVINMVAEQLKERD